MSNPDFWSLQKEQVTRALKAAGETEGDSFSDTTSSVSSTDKTFHLLDTEVDMEDNKAILTSLRKKLERLRNQAGKTQDSLARDKDRETPDTIDVEEYEETQATLKRQQADYEALSAQVFDGENDPSALEDDEAKSDEMKRIMRAATKDCTYLLSQGNIQAGLTALDLKVRTLTGAYELQPENNHDKAVTAVFALAEQLELDLRKSRMPKEEELRGHAEHVLERALAIQGRVAGVKTTDTKPPLAAGSKGYLKLKHIDVPTFSGKTEDWMAFSRLFNKAVHSNDHLDEDAKLTYLVQAMKEPRVKQEIAERLDQTIMDELEHTHNKPRWMHRRYVDQLRNMETRPRTREGLMLLLSEGHVINNGLLRLKGGTINTILTSTLETVMDPITRSLWNQKTDGIKHTPPVEDMFTFIKDQADQLEASSPKEKVRQRPMPRQRGSVNHVVNDTPRYKGSGQRQGQQQQQQQQQPQGSITNSYRGSCPLCQGTHSLYYCSAFEQLTVPLRKEKVVALKLCMNCLKPNHMARECNSSYRCKATGCKGKHSTLLHEERTVQPAPPTTHQTSTATHSDPDEEDEECLLMTARVTVRGPAGQLTVRALLDSGSTLSIISERLVRQLSLSATGRQVSITGINSGGNPQLHPMCKVELASEYKPDWRKGVQVASMREVIRKLPFQDVPHVKELPHLRGLQLADSQFHHPGKIELLLGQNVWRHLFLEGRVKGATPSQPEAWHTVFGWTVLGSYGQTPAQHTINHITAAADTNEKSDAILARFHELEEPSTFSTPFTPKEIKVEEHYRDNHTYDPDQQRYMVRLPKVENPPSLGESKTQAVNRAHANERSLIRKGKYGPFQAVMQEYVSLGHAVEVTSQQKQSKETHSTNNVYFMPVHAVYKETSSTTKVRAVFDASARTTTQHSLNDILAVGPTLHPTIDQVLLRFRQYPVAISSDISKMYREVLLHPDDQHLHQYIWREAPDVPWKTYKMTRVTFGVAASPYLAVKTLQQAGKDHGEEHPNAQWHITHSFYVDDLLGGANTPQEALTLYNNLNKILEKATFKLRKWRSSSSEVLDAIPKELQEPLPTQELVDQHAATYPKALGVSWDSGRDTMFTNISLPTNYNSTKRGVISDVARTFDVLGWISPTILPMKLLYRDLWKSNTDWDDPVTSEQADQHRKWREELPLLKEIQLDRCYFSGGVPSSVELHGYSDASQDAYAAVVYLRATYPTAPPSVQLVISKSKVAPLKTRSVPQLELCGAKLLAMLLTTTRQTLDIPIEDVYSYTDSTIVLGWLGGESGKYCIFSSHRIAATTILLPYKHWLHVPTHENPADVASRGTTALELINHDLWWHGPKWLSSEPVAFPQQPTGEHLADQRKEEMKPEPKVVMAVTQAPYFEQRQNDFLKLIRIVCWSFRFFNRLKGKEVSSHLTQAEGQTAVNVLLKRAQARSFPQEIAAIKSKQNISQRSKILVLHPIMGKDNLLRIGGRLWNSEQPYHTKHHVILSAADHLTRILFRHYHLLLGHCGPSTLLTHSANLYHVVGGRTLARTTCNQCITCRKQAAKASSQLLGQLPPERVEPQHVFLHTGMDFCGPFKIRQGYTRKPVEIEVPLAIFICMATKAVHLEVVSDQKTPALLAAIDRFVARRGMPLHLYSDNGPNYTGAKNQLFKLYQSLSSTQGQDALQAYVFQHHITWHNSPQRAPHFGGLWEAAVKSTKHHLKRIIGQERLTYEEFNTISCNVESFLNSRPLGPVTSHSLDGLSPLTPAHFLIGRAARSYPTEPVSGKPTTLQRWDICRKAAQDFWDRWSQEYLQHLQKATKWHKISRNYRVGDLVMLTDGSKFKCQWSMAKVIKTYPGQDGLVRAVDVQLETKVLPRTYANKEQLASKITTTTSIFRRPITRLALLLAADEVPGDRVDLDNPVPLSTSL